MQRTNLSQAAADPTIPEPGLSISFVAGSSKKAGNAVRTGSGDLWKVPPSSIHVYPDFNPRVRDGAYEARVRWIADRIKAYGYDPKEPIKCFTVREGNADKFYVWDGHRRLEAALLAIEEGCELKQIPVIAVGSEAKIEDLSVGLVTAHDNEPLRPYEVAVVVARLVNFQWDMQKIAERLGFTTVYCEGLLALANAPLEIRTHVATGRIAARMAIQLMRERGSEAIELINDMVRRAQEAGKDRATAKHLPGAAVKKFRRTRADEMADTLRRLKSDRAYHAMNPELRERLDRLLSDMQAVEDEERSRASQATIPV